jgi:hypothetical protein
LIARVPRSALGALGARRDIASITPAPDEIPMGGLANETAATGASSWWTSGHLGGTGSSDEVPVNLAVMDDKIQEDQPLFQGVHFERPDTAISGTRCGQAAAGCEHGTEVAGMAVALGNSTCATLCAADSGSERGVAYGVAHVLDADTAAIADWDVCLFDSALWALGVTQAPIGECSHALPGARFPAYVHSDSHGSYTDSDDSAYGQNLDKFTSTFGAIQTEPSGNDGVGHGGAGRITDSCIAYDVICVGGVSVGDTTTVADDSIANFSSPGPSPSGRKKPDLVAVAAGGGSTNISVVEQRYSYWNRLERGDTGTSFASPQVAGAAALLYGSGLTDPLIVKAILLDSTTLGRATPSSAMGTQVTWQPDWGWGELNLDSGYQQRTNFAADGVGARDVRFYRANVNAGDRATLVWNRRVAGAPDQTAAPETLTLSNLDLYEYAAAPQTELASSESTIDNVEQVRGTGSGTVVYKVKDQSSTVDGTAEEPFALAAKNPLTPLAAPKPTVTLTLDRSAARQGDEVTLTESVHNSSSDLAGANSTASLGVPPGVTVTSGGSTTWSPGAGSLAPGATASHQWTVQGSADGSYQLAASAETSAYDEAFDSQVTKTLAVDSTAPDPAINCSHSGGADPHIAVSWDAVDSSPVTSYDVDVSTDGAPFTSWLAHTTVTSATFNGEPGHSYAFQARASDELANASTFVVCGPTTVGFAPVPPAAPLPPATEVLPASPHLTLSEPRRSHGRLVIDGRLATRATGRVTWTFTPQRRHALRGHALVRHGRFRLVLRLRAAIQSRGGLLRVQYSGDRSYAPQRISRRMK